MHRQLQLMQKKKTTLHEFVRSNLQKTTFFLTKDAIVSAPLLEASSGGVGVHKCHAFITRSLNQLKNLELNTISSEKLY